MPKKQPKSHTADEFDLDVLSSDIGIFRWFLLCYLFGKPIRSETAVATWRLFIKKKLDTPWAIVESSDHALVRVLHAGGYTRYQHVTAHGLKVCTERLIREYEGSLVRSRLLTRYFRMINYSYDTHFIQTVFCNLGRR